MPLPAPIPFTTVDRLQDSISFANRQIADLESQLADLQNRTDLTAEARTAYRDSLHFDIAYHREWAARYQRWIDAY